METCKTKAIQVDLGILKHNQAYSSILRHNQAYPGITQAYLEIFRTLHNHGIFRTLTYSVPEEYSETCQR